MFGCNPRASRARGHYSVRYHGEGGKASSTVFYMEIIMWFLPGTLHHNTSYRLGFGAQNYFDYSSCHPLYLDSFSFANLRQRKPSWMFTDAYWSDRKAVCLYALHFAERLKWPFNRPTIKLESEKSAGPRYKTLSNLADINTNRME